VPPVADPLEAAFAELASRLGHGFAAPALLRTALTHRSYANEHREGGATPVEHNDRLEFLGDAVLGLSVGHLLMGLHPEVSEGERRSKKQAEQQAARQALETWDGGGAAPV